MLQVENFETLERLLEASGVKKGCPPPQNEHCVAMLRSKIDGYTAEGLMSLFGNHDIHVVPTSPPSYDFSASVCADFGADIYDQRAVHGKPCGHFMLLYTTP